MITNPSASRKIKADEKYKIVRKKSPALQNPVEFFRQFSKCWARLRPVGVG
jgi:hypothetical protein